MSTPWERAGSLEELLSMTKRGFRPLEPRADFVSNSKGFRTKEYSRIKAPGIRRVLTLGDSFTYGSGGVPYDSFWPVLLESHLRERTGESVEVLNLGIAAVGPVFQVRLWQLEGSKLDADLVVFAFFVGNDFTDHSGNLVDDTAVDRLAYRSLAIRLGRNLARVWRADVKVPAPELTGQWRELLSTNTQGGIRIRDLLPSYVYPYDPEEPTFSEEAFLKIERRRMRLCDLSKVEAFEEHLEVAGAAILALRDQVVESGADFLLMIIPDEYQVDGALVDEILALDGRDPREFDLSLPQRRLTAFLDRNRIAYVDLLEASRAAGAPLYKRRNTHWNPAGNALAAESLAPTAARLLEIDPEGAAP